MIDINISGIIKIEMKDDDNQVIDSETETMVRVYHPDEADAGAFLDGGVSGKIIFEASANDEKIKFLMDISDVRRVIKFMEN